MGWVLKVGWILEQDFRFDHLIRLRHYHRLIFVGLDWPAHSHLIYNRNHPDPGVDSLLNRQKHLFPSRQKHLFPNHYWPSMFAWGLCLFPKIGSISSEL
jgi:hypothetical protein